MTTRTARPARRLGFTMLELIVVIVVLGVLASIAVVGYKQVTERSTTEADRLSLVAVAREAAAVVAIDQTTISRSQVAAALEDCGGCTLETFSATVAADAGSWRVVGHDYGTASAPDVAVDPGGDDTRAWTYGYVLGSGWDTNEVNLVMASRVDGRFVHAALRGYGNEVRSWVDGDPEPVGSATADETHALTATAAGGDTEITVTWSHVGDAANYTVTCSTADVAAAGTAALVTPAGADEGDELSAIVGGLENFVEHTCQVTADNGDTSNEVTATPTTSVVNIADNPTGDPFWPGSGSTDSVTPNPVTALDDGIDTPETIAGDGITGLVAFPAAADTYPRTFYVTAGPSGAVITVTETAAGVATPSIFLPRDTFEFPAGIVAGPSPDHNQSGYTTLYLTDSAAGEVWRVDPSSGAKVRIASGLSNPTDVDGFRCFTASGTPAGGVCLYVTTSSGLVQLDVGSGVVHPIDATLLDGSAVRAVGGAAGELWVSSPTALRRLATNGTAFSPNPATTAMSVPSDIDVFAGQVFITDHGTDTTPGGVFTHTIGDPGANPTRLVTTGDAITRPAGLWVHRPSSALYLIDNNDHCLRKTTTMGGATVTLWCSVAPPAVPAVTSSCGGAYSSGAGTKTFSMASCAASPGDLLIISASQMTTCATAVSINLPGTVMARSGFNADSCRNVMGTFSHMIADAATLANGITFNVSDAGGSGRIDVYVLPGMSVQGSKFSAMGNSPSSGVLADANFVFAVSVNNRMGSVSAPVISGLTPLMTTGRSAVFASDGQAVTVTSAGHEMVGLVKVG